ncbi:MULTISPECIES: MFS transporter [Clostridium]|uniref:Predicted transporter n=3 Tax=Clostridium TaxID=1485 RepID=D8GSD7_CLOLD|nr:MULTISPECIES: MFS transporter [Clostridium]ADK16519.1 predicted transporter [Clostridium ljungdahlii DSM 13528]AGY75600.1 MFS transporter [Clostridium autoethanogenum DSM 10061]ALU35763.1 Major facilitator superfamily MFS_1 [Clostridium autoethanogenum DSM 10061]OAA89612.1 putative sulfoacetate transporter SauU [Clostridium ljungdahlii DSM 13528]OVY52175.1 putative sulfoacetate transporter SauU [Clostridium autoethanogenum]
MKKGRYRYFIIFMVLAIMTINYIDRGALSYGQADIIKEYGLNAQSWGAVMGYFGYGYAVGGLFGGFLADKKGPKFTWIVFGSIWSVFEMLTAFAGDIGITVFGGSALAGFFVVRVLFGLAEGPSFVSMSRTMANWVAPKERTFCSSLTLIGTPLGSVITAPIAVTIISLTNWKVMLVTMGLLGLVWASIFSRVFTSLPEDNPRISKEELAEIRYNTDLKTKDNVSQDKIHWFDFFKNPSLICNTVGFFACSYIIFLLLTWTPKYLQDVYHFKLTSLWYLGMIPWIGPIFTTVLGGKISDYIRMRTGNLRFARNSVSVISLLLSSICFLLIPKMGSAMQVLLLMALGNSAALAANSIYWSNLIDIEPSKTGTFSGIMHFLGQTSAFIAPTLTGTLVKNYGYSAAFIIAGIICAVGMVCMFFVKFKNVEIDNGQVEKNFSA